MCGSSVGTATIVPPPPPHHHPELCAIGSAGGAGIYQQ
jgi:hypothetical protein